MPTSLDEPAQAVSAVHMRWVNPPADVTDAISALQHHCEAWPKTPVNNPLAIVPGAEAAICQAVTGHALLVPEDLAMSILQIGSLLVGVFIVAVIALAVLAGVVFRMWSKFFGPPRPPKPAKPAPDVLTSIVTVIGWLGWLSASGLAAQYSPRLMPVFLTAVLMWTLVVQHLVSLLRNKSA
jgi:hypothetical protein